MKNLVLQHSAAWDIVSKRFMYLPESLQTRHWKVSKFWQLINMNNTKEEITSWYKSSYYAYPWQRFDLLCNLNVLLLFAVQSCKQFLVAKFG